MHASLTRLGWVVGGAQAVVQALLGAVGPTGTVVMQTHTSGNSDPAKWENPPVPHAWWQVIRDHMPAYDPTTSPTRAMGAIVDVFRSWPGTIRSVHPGVSCAANGPLAEAITEPHPLTPCFGAGSPLHRLYEHGALVVLLGVSHENDTLLHYAEHLADWPEKRHQRVGAALTIDGERRWIEYDDLDGDSDDFGMLGDAFAAETGLERRSGPIRVSPARELIEFAVPWLSRHRTLHPPGT